jgi:hypothetical protein
MTAMMAELTAGPTAALKAALMVDWTVALTAWMTVD